MYNRLIEFIEKHDLLSNSQYGFRKHHATHAILDIMNQIHSNLDNKLYTCAVFWDLKKASDTVNHNILQKKTKYLWYKRMHARLVCVLPLQRIPNYFNYILYVGYDQNHIWCATGLYSRTSPFSDLYKWPLNYLYYTDLHGGAKIWILFLSGKIIFYEQA